MTDPTTREREPIEQPNPTVEALRRVEAHVQWCREEGETDLRGILHFIREEIRDQLTHPTRTVSDE